MSLPSGTVVVVSRYDPKALELDDNGKPIINEDDKQNDGLDNFNHPRYRRVHILKDLSQFDGHFEFQVPPTKCNSLEEYRLVHSAGLVEFLSTAWKKWDAMGPEGQDPMSSLPTSGNNDDGKHVTPPLIPGNTSLPRDPYQQRPSKNVMGQMGYYCTDTCTPVFEQLLEELEWDAAVIQEAVQACSHGSSVVYALATHPGHHASRDAFGGYCYVNHAALAAKLLQNRHGGSSSRVAVLDIDYHVGNGTASIFYEDQNVLMISIHCHPDHDYPFHSGFEDENGAGPGQGATLNLPLLPGATWKDSYQQALQTAMDKIRDFGGVQALVVSMGLDTLGGDPCAIRRAGFQLQVDDYLEVGRMIGGALVDIPILVIQEGGYKMNEVPRAAANVLVGCAEAKCSK